MKLQTLNYSQSQATTQQRETNTFNITWKFIKYKETSPCQKKEKQENNEIVW